MMHGFKKCKSAPVVVGPEAMVGGEVISSTSDIKQQPTKKMKKKRFHVFHRHRDNTKSEPSRFSHSRSDSLPLHNGDLATHDHLSLNSTWNQGNWKGLDSDQRDGSAYSSTASLLSVESEGKELTDEELVESLVNPHRSDSPVVSVTPVSL